MRAGREQLDGERGDTVDDGFAAVEDEQHPPEGGEVRGQRAAASSAPIPTPISRATVAATRVSCGTWATETQSRPPSKSPNAAARRPASICPRRHGRPG